MRRRLLCSASALSLFIAQGTALAQSAEEAEAPPPDAMMADELLVLGTKIERSFLDTPTSVGIVTSEEISDYFIFDTFESFNRLANVRRLNTDGGNDSFQVRGLNADGIADIANTATLVSLIIDGATQNLEGLRRGARSTWDLDQIEVLRGPQSGLYGRAALAGAVVLTSKDPTFDYEAAAKFNVGTTEAVGGAFMISGPILEDEVAFRISGELQTEETDITITDPVNDFLAEDEFRNLRGKLLIEPDALPDLSALFTINYAFDQTASRFVSQPFFDREFDEGGVGSEGREAEVTNYIANISYAATDALTVRSISSFIDTDLEIFSPPGADVFVRDDTRDGKDFTQDLAVEIEDQDGTGLSGVIGAFYGDFDQEIDTDIRIDLPALGGGEPSGELSLFQQGTSSSETRSFALYADLRYNFWGPFSFLGGLRYQRDKVSNRAETTTLFGGETSFDVEAEFNVFLPKVGLSYDITDTQTVSAFASRGYRQGFTENIVGTALQNDVDPEFVWTYELAYRYQSEDGSLSFGANAFFNDYNDQQIVIINPDFAPLTNTFNAGDSRSFGLEVEGRYEPLPGLSLFGSLGLIKTNINDLEDEICAPSGGNCSGNEFPEAPSVTAAIGGIYRHHSGFFGSAEVNYTGSYFTNGDINNLPELEIDSFFLINASVGYEMEHVQARLFVRNLLNNDYLTSIDRSLTRASVGEARTVGAELNVRF
ncbi:MAG: TonB-dependent receptor [Pseudomonadota bacterium]